jgi:transposase
MGGIRPPYPPEFRQQIVELVHAGRTPEELGRDFEPSAQAIRNWVKQADRGEGRRQDGLSRLHRENRRLRDGVPRADAELRAQGRLVNRKRWLKLCKRISRLV